MTEDEPLEPVEDLEELSPLQADPQVEGTEGTDPDDFTVEEGDPAPEDDPVVPYEDDEV